MADKTILQTAASAVGLGGDTPSEPVSTSAGATSAALDTSGAASITPATEFSPSGAPRQVTEIDVSHQAIDNDPRARTTVNQNKIDMNDPTIDGADAVAAALGMKNRAEAEAEAKAEAEKAEAAKSQGKKA